MGAKDYNVGRDLRSTCELTKKPFGGENLQE